MSHLLLLEVPKWWSFALMDVLLETDEGSSSQNLFYFHFHRLYREREQTDVQLYATVL